MIYNELAFHWIHSNQFFIADPIPDLKKQMHALFITPCKLAEDNDQDSFFSYRSIHFHSTMASVTVS